MSFLDNIKAVPITDYATRSGFTLVRKGKYFSLKEHDSVIIDVEKNCFWRNSRFSKGYKGGAGSIIDFAIEFNGATDNDEAGEKAWGIINEELTEKGLKCVRFAPQKGKDWNDFIVNTKP